MPGTADQAQPPGAEGVDQRVDLVLVEQSGHEDDGCAGVEVRAPALDRVLEHLAAVLVAGPEERVGAGVEHEVGDPFGWAAPTAAATAAAASATGFSWSSRLAPTTPSPTARRMVPAGSP